MTVGLRAGATRLRAERAMRGAERRTYRATNLRDPLRVAFIKP